MVDVFYKSQLKVRNECSFLLGQLSCYSLCLEGHTVIGIHYRGNDHAEELPGGRLIPLEVSHYEGDTSSHACRAPAQAGFVRFLPQLYIMKIRELVRQAKSPKIFVATDSEMAVRTMVEAFGEDMVASTTAARTKGAG